MSQIRPKILLRYGRINLPIRVPISDQLVDPLTQTFITTAAVAGASSLTVANITNFARNQVLLVGEPGLQGSEIISTSSTTSPSSPATITLASALIYAHPANTPVYRLYYNQVEISNALTTTGSKTVLQNQPVSIVADMQTTDVNDLVNTTGYYFARFVYSYSFLITITRSGSTATATATQHGLSTGQSVTITGAVETEYNGTFTVTVTGLNTFTYAVPGTPASPATGTITAAVTQYSTYSDAAPYGGYTLLSARSCIDKALMMINKQVQPGGTLTDEYAFSEIDNCQTECLREFKRWSFMQSFDTIIGETETGSWKVVAPDNLEDNVTYKSVYNFRIGKEPDMQWVDKEEWDALITGIAYSTLAVAAVIGDGILTLVSSKDFDDEGTVQVGPNQYTWTANNKTTNVLTLGSLVLANAPINQDVFQFANLGWPSYWTIFGGYIYHWPAIGSVYNHRNYYMDYYIKQTVISSDAQNIVLPDPTVVQYFLAWKFLLRLNNGEDSPAIQSMYNNYILRREKMKQKESINRNFILNPDIVDNYYNQGN